MKILKGTRFLHKWAGLLLTILISVMALTGFLMNHEDWLECERSDSRAERGEHTFVYFNDDNAEQMITRLANECGTKDIKEIKIKSERGGYTWEIKSNSGDKIKIRNGVSRVNSPEKKNNFYKDLVKRIHKGEFAGSVGWYLIDVGAVGIIILTFSGLYLSLRTMYKKWRRTGASLARDRATEKV